MSPTCLVAQEATSEEASVEDGARQLNVRFLALGHRRLAKFVRSKKARVIKIKTPDGETIEETIPSGVPIEVLGKEFEYLPSLVYIRDRRARKSGGYAVSPLILNAATQEKTLTYRSHLSLFLRKPTGEGGEQVLSRYVSAPVGEEQTHMLMTLVNRFDRHEGWKTPIVKTFDTSPKALPGGSVLFFNATPFPIEIDVPIGSKVELRTLAPMKSMALKPMINKDGRTLVRARLVAKNGAKRQFYYNSVRLSEDGRAYMFAYFDPRRKTSNPAGMVQFSDEIEVTSPVSVN
ncbi:hypothetical protein JIN77_01065 [Verrucomicrobiaceae bacterium R5-34]|uniref:Uncharacterized protein n=1 Tax=Oceaniferula flava TaxID=2800421 RepID=A0AAE2VAP2_9BACT|nr:hypothetical protein [Oceaniferula flavus]MBK1829303.1 hypothetical protein [Verrucomicrobiaceae bacterium R5-34]MBK1853530.1 hypothetical protein [Oceaniferula flavus]MBM1134835.1 hypothetical protein [Oceaniferula flavus]